MATTGTLALIGSGEYLPPIQPLDFKLLQHIEGTPRVVVLPTAAAPDGAGVPERWANMGVAHFSLLKAEVEPVMLLTRADAHRPELVEKIQQANFVYFSGGKPRYLLETLQNTPAWEAVIQVYRNGGVIAGCSAGAMVMGSFLFDFPNMWHTLPALGLARGLVIIPHFDEIPRLMLATLRHSQDYTIVGVDGSTALIGREGGWTVYGKGAVTVFQEKKQVAYREGELIKLPEPPLT